MNILVTGGAGFIGSHLAKRLLDENHNVIVIDNLSTGNLDYIKDLSVRFNCIDIVKSDLSLLFEHYRFDCVYHLAAQINLRTSFEQPVLDAQTNIVGSLNLIQNCVKYNVKKFIFSSSGGAIYSSKDSLPYSENSIADPASPYGLAKLTVEKYLDIFKQTNELNYTCLRYSNVYGPKQSSKSEAGVISIFFQRAKENKDIIIFGDGMQTRDFVYVDDVVEANVLALQHDIRGNFNVSTEIKTNINKLADDILRLTKSHSDVIHQDAIAGELLHSCLSYDKLHLATGWKPKQSIDQGILLTANYWK